MIVDVDSDTYEILSFWWLFKFLLVEADKIQLSLLVILESEFQRCDEHEPK